MAAKKSPLRVAVSSDKCDFRMQTGSLSLVGQVSPDVSTLTAGLPGGGVRVSSDKCDWQVGSLRLPGGKTGGRLQSDKCDFQIAAEPGRSYAEFIRTPTSVDVAGGHPAFGGRVASSKCDWTLQGKGIERFAEVKAGRKGVDVRLDDIRVGGGMSSSKCDFSLEAAFNRRSLPELQARMSSDKCDFSLQVEFGIRGGQRFRIQATGSAKCDFRIEDMRTSAGRGWKKFSSEPDVKRGSR